MSNRTARRLAADPVNLPRTAAIKVALSLPKGDSKRRAILAALQGDKEAKSKLDGVRGHTLMPADLKGKIPKLYSQEDVEDPKAWVKFFSPYSGAVWFVTEFDGSDTMFGWAEMFRGGGELGYISLSELENLHRGGLPLVERDLSWRPRPLSQAKRER
jgi:hypothetical protein